jgi:hypothetical protein
MDSSTLDSVVEVACSISNLDSPSVNWTSHPFIGQTSTIYIHIAQHSRIVDRALLSLIGRGVAPCKDCTCVCFVITSCGALARRVCLGRV